MERTISRSIGIVQDFPHEAAVDLQEIDREVLEVAERGQAGAEVIQRELAAQLLQRLDEAIGLREARHRRGLGDLEADLRGIEAAAMELVDHERQELVIAQALAREVDRAQRQASRARRPRRPASASAFSITQRSMAGVMP